MKQISKFLASKVVSLAEQGLFTRDLTEKQNGYLQSGR